MMFALSLSLGFIFRAAIGEFCFWPGYVRRALRRFLKAMRRDRLAAVGSGKVALRCATGDAIGEWVGAAPDGIFSAASRVGRSHGAPVKSQTRRASMKATAVRCAAALSMVAFAAPLPATAQYFPPALIIVPPPAQNYATPRPAPKPPPDKPKPTADTPPAAKPAGHYQGQTFVPD
jgi:hypothetical protein